MATLKSWVYTSCLLLIICSQFLQSSHSNDQEDKHKHSKGPDETVSKPGWGSWNHPPKPDEKPPKEHHKEECNCNCRCNCPPAECPPNNGGNNAGLLCTPVNCDPKHGCNIGNAMNLGMGNNFNMPFFGTVRSGAPHQGQTKSSTQDVTDTDTGLN